MGKITKSTGKKVEVVCDEKRGRKEGDANEK